MSFELDAISKCARPWIGGSGIAAIAELPNPGNRTPTTEFYRFLGEAPELDDDDEEFFEGRFSLENYMAHKLRRKAKVVPICFNQRYTDPEYSFLRAEIDAETEDENDEFKTSTEFLGREFGEAGSDDFPSYMAAQVQWGLMIRPKPKAFLNVCLGFDRFKRFPVMPEPEVQAFLREKALRFMFDHVLKGIPPEPINLDDVKLRWPKSIQKSLLADPQSIDRLKHMAAIDADIKRLDGQKDGLKLEVQKVFGENDAMIDETGKIVATFKSNKPSIILDKDGLIDEYETELRKLLLTGGLSWIEAKRKARTSEKLGARPLLNKLK